MKGHIHAGSTQSSSIYIIFEVTVGSSGCCRVLGSALCFGDCVLMTGFH